MSKFENDTEKYKWFFFYAISPDMNDKEKDFKWKMALDKFNHLNKSKIESKFENEQEKKVREILTNEIEDFSDNIINIKGEYRQEEIDFFIEGLMLRIRPYLKVQKKWMGDAL